MDRLDNDAAGESEIGIFDVVLTEMLGAHDGVEVAPPRGKVAFVRIDESADLAVKESKAVGRDRFYLGDTRVELRVARTQIVQQRNAALQFGAGSVGDQRQITVSD